MTDSDLQFDLWCSRNRHRTKQSVHESEAFEIFRDGLYDLCMSKIGTSQSPDAYFRPYWVSLLWRWKRWAENPDTLDIPRAKAVPILQLFQKMGYEVSRAGIHCCPFHPDKTPSLQVYTKTNSWFCHGACGTGGDTIAWVMKLNGGNFRQAVKFLS